MNSKEIISRINLNNKLLDLSKGILSKNECRELALILSNGKEEFEFIEIRSVEELASTMTDTALNLITKLNSNNDITLSIIYKVKVSLNLSANVPATEFNHVLYYYVNENSVCIHFGNIISSIVSRSILSSPCTGKQELQILLQKLSVCNIQYISTAPFVQYTASDKLFSKYATLASVTSNEIEYESSVGTVLYGNLKFGNMQEIKKVDSDDTLLSKSTSYEAPVFEKTEPIVISVNTKLHSEPGDNIAIIIYIPES